MDFSFSEEQESLRELAEKIFKDLATHDRLKQLEGEPENFDRELWRELANADLLGVALAEEYGGGGFGFMELGLLLEQAGRAVAPIPLVPTLVLAAEPIQKFGTDEQKQAYLPRVASGEVVLTAALEEKGSDDPLRSETSARPDGDGYRLDGNKICVPAAQLAERILVPAQTPDGGLGVFFVDPNAEGVTLERVETTNFEPRAHLQLSGVRVGAADVLGDIAAGPRIVAWLVERATAALCAVQLGVSDRALRLTAEYVTGREQFDRPIGSFQAVHQRAADAYIQVEGMRLTTWEALSRLAADEPAGDSVAVAKFWAAEGGQIVGNASQHLHGGIGVDVDYPVHRYYLWARQLELMLGSGQRQLARIGAGLAEAAGAR